MAGAGRHHELPRGSQLLGGEPEQNLLMALFELGLLQGRRLPQTVPHWGSIKVSLAPVYTVVVVV